MDLVISVWILGLKHGSLISKVNHGIPVWILGLHCELSDSCVDLGNPVWVLDFMYGS